MKMRTLTYLMLLMVLIGRTGSVCALISDPIVSALDEVNLKIETVGTLQDDYTALAKGYMQGKMGSLGDVKQVQKQAKKLEQAKASVEKLQKEKNKLMKYVEKAKELKEKALAKVQEFQELKEKIETEVHKFDEEYLGKIREAQALAEQKYKEAREYYEGLATKAEEAKETLKEYGIEDEDTDYAEDMDYAEDEEEPESARVAFGVVPQVRQTVLPTIKQTLQYSVPQGIAEDGSFLQSVVPSAEMTILPAADSVTDKRISYINETELTAAVPDITELPDRLQMIKMSSEDVLLQARQAEDSTLPAQHQPVLQKSKLSLKDQLLEKDDVQPREVKSAQEKAFSADRVLSGLEKMKWEDAVSQENLPSMQQDALVSSKKGEVLLSPSAVARRKDMKAKSLRRNFRPQKAVKVGDVND